MRFIAFAMALMASSALPLAASELTTRITDEHILPAFQTLATDAATLAQVANQDCSPHSTPLRAAYGAAFDSWIAVSHFRFGPTEVDNRAFGLAFWPDSRGKTPKALRKLIHSEDQGIQDPTRFSNYSIAGRGFYALEFLLFDPEISATGSATYRCALTRAISTDIAATAQAISQDWHQHYAAEVRSPTSRYQTNEEITQELFKALNTGLQVMDDMRLGRPLGSFERPRPLRAEARRSGRSLHHVQVSLDALNALTLSLTNSDAALRDALDKGFDKVRKRANALNDPTFAGVAQPDTRIRVEALQQEVKDLRALVTTKLGPALGVAAGFNALDGD